jgi:hypothetical protein
MLPRRGPQVSRRHGSNFRQKRSAERQIARKLEKNPPENLQEQLK